MSQLDTDVRASFVAQFDKVEAKLIERAAQEHKDGIGVAAHKGESPFRWALTVVIGFDCVNNETYRQYHGITLDPEEFASWCRHHAQLRSFTDGGDMLGMLGGHYQRYLAPEMPE